MAAAATASCAEALRQAMRQCDAARRWSDDDALANVFLDFEDAHPTAPEQECFELATALLEQGHLILNDFASYGDGASQSIRQAIRNPDDMDQQLKTWTVLNTYVKRLKTYYDFAHRIEQVVIPLLVEVYNGPLPPLEQIQAKQALIKQFAHIIDFTLRFDEMKMCTPAVQNDYSYYRRTVSKGIALELQKQSLALNPSSNSDDLIVPVDIGHLFSLFYADPTPMLSKLRDTLLPVSANFMENTVEILSAMANICRCMVNTPTLHTKFRYDTTIPFCLRVMTGAIILYDHVHPDGAFVRNSPIDVRACVRCLQTQYDRTLKYEKSTQNDPVRMPSTGEPLNSSILTCDSSARITSLLNALRYTTKHANDAKTPKSMKQLLQLRDS